MLRRCLVLTGLLAVLLTGCGDDPAPTGPAAGPEPPGAPVELRVVLASDREPPPDSLVKQQLDNLDCDAASVPVAPEESLATCDDDGTKYVLEPASIVDGIETAVAEIPEGQAAWVVTVDLDEEATQALAEVTDELAVSRLQLAVVLDGRVLAAPRVETPVPDGRLQIAGDFTEEQATALADRLAG